MSIKVKQQDLTDCAAACIASVAAHYKLALPVARIRQMASTNKKGTSVAGVLEALNALGFVAKAGRGDLSALMNVSKPTIVHVVTRARLHHFVVVYGLNARCVELMDPADGRIHNYPHNEFLQLWTGILIVILPGEKFSPGTKTTPLWIRLGRLV